NTGANDAIIHNSINLNLGTSSVGRKLTATSDGIINLNGSITANAMGDSIILSGTGFDNAGAFSLNPGTNGRFLVWSSNANPFGGATPDNRGGIAYNFKQYNETYGVTSVLESRNGFVYTLALSIYHTLTCII